MSCTLTWSTPFNVPHACCRPAGHEGIHSCECGEGCDGTEGGSQAPGSDPGLPTEPPPSPTQYDGPGSPQWDAECQEFGCHSDGADT